MSIEGGEAVVMSSASNGMGGWHEVKTSDGKLLKLQRNSLVIQTVGELLHDIQAAEVAGSSDLDTQERRPRQKRGAGDPEPEYSPRRLRRQTAGRVPLHVEAAEMVSSFARNVSRDSIEKYAQAYDIHFPSNDESWTRLLEQCSQHYSRQKAVESNEIPNLLLNVHLALKKDRCRLKEPR